MFLALRAHHCDGLLFPLPPPALDWAEDPEARPGV